MFVASRFYLWMCERVFGYTGERVGVKAARIYIYIYVCIQDASE